MCIKRRLSVTQKRLTQRNVSFQVNGVVALYGKQSYIPRSIDPAMSSSNHADSVVMPQQPQRSNDNETTPQNKARLNHMVAIPSKRSLDLQLKNNIQVGDQSQIAYETTGKTYKNARDHQPC